MIKDKRLIQQCPGWCQAIDVLDYELRTNRSLKFCNGLIVRIVRDKRYYTTFSFEVDSSWTIQDWWKNKSALIKNDVLNNIAKDFNNLITKLPSLCTKCGLHKEPLKNYLNINNNVDGINYDSCKAYCEIQIFGGSDELCKTCVNLNREELRLQACTLSKVTGDQYILKNYKFQQICEYDPWNDSNRLVSLLDNANPIDLNKKIRYVSPNGRFALANCGSYLFFENELFVKKRELGEINPFELDIIKNKEIYEKVVFAGHDTGFIDDYGKEIYTGDILRIKGSLNSNRDQYRYFKKDRCIKNLGQNYYEVCGVVSEHIYLEDYNVVCDNHGAFLCHGIEIEIIGNIFFDLDPNSKLDIRSIACSIGQWGFKKCPNLNDVASVQAHLKTIKTPSFKSKKKWWKIF